MLQSNASQQSRTAWLPGAGQAVRAPATHSCRKSPSRILRHNTNNAWPVMPEVLPADSLGATCALRTFASSPSRPWPPHRAQSEARHSRQHQCHRSSIPGLRSDGIALLAARAPSATSTPHVFVRPRQRLAARSTPPAPQKGMLSAGSTGPLRM